MKKLLCYVGILLLLFLVVLPPLLRRLLPDMGEEEPAKKEEERMLLTCSNENFVINTSYENSQIQMIVLKKLSSNQEQTDNVDSNDENTSSDNKLDVDDSKENQTENESELSLAFDDLKTKGDITYKQLEDGEVIGIDFSVSNHEKLNLASFTKPIDEQKIYYENQELSCTIRIS